MEAAEFIRVDPEALRETTARIFRGFDLPDADADRVADGLVEADLIGVASHGVSNYIAAIYAPGLRAGTIVARPDLRTVHETPVSAVVDGGSGMGIVVGRHAMDLAIAKAKDVGVGLVAVRNSRHYGMAGYYALQAPKHDMLGLSLTNTDPLVLPTFGRDPRLGTNPISVAVPSGSEAPFLLDMATSTVPLGKILLAQRAGAAIPSGWASDADASPTTDSDVAAAARRLVPLGGDHVHGGHKGYGLAALVDMCCGVLSGSGIGALGGLGGSVGHFFGAVRVDLFRPLDEFRASMDDYLRYLLESAPVSPDEPVIYAGIKEARAREDRLANGIPLHPQVVETLRELCKELGDDPTI